METCFVISAFGDKDCDKVYEEIYVLVCKSLGLKVVRLDKVNDGSLIMNQIISNINDSKIIIADLTLARPNCYFEIGYAMGAKKESRLFLTCREDHRKDSDKFNKDGHKIHFDLAGYPISFWDLSKLNEFEKDLRLTIESRMKLWEPAEDVLNTTSLSHNSGKSHHSVISERFDKIKTSVSKEE